MTNRNPDTSDQLTMPVLREDVAEAISAVAAKTELEDKPQRVVTADLLNRAVLLDITYKQWTNRAKAERTNMRLTDDARPRPRYEKTAAADRLNTTMKLIDSPAYDTITTRTNEIRKWVSARCMPSFLVNGIFFVKVAAVSEFEAEIAKFNDWLIDEGVPALQADWARAMTQAKDDFDKVAAELGIASPYNVNKYPDPADLRRRFGVAHSWVTFGVPENLPQAIRESEEIKVRARFEEAAVEIEAALLEGFAELIAHATDRLTIKRGQPAPMVKEALVENFKEFCETFRLRNLTDNRQLEELVQQAECIMGGTTARNLRERPRARAEVAKQLSTIKAAVDQMIVDAPRRKIDVDDLED